MDNLEQQIRNFWEHQTSPEQRREILRQLDGSGMEWKDFLLQYYKKVLAGQEPGSLSDEQKTRIWQRLKDQHLTDEVAGPLRNIAAKASTPGEGRLISLPTRENAEPQGKLTEIPIRRIKRAAWLAAASVLAIISLGIYQWNKPTTTKPTDAPPIASTQPPTKKIIEKKNEKAGEQTYTLPDNSTAILAPGSTLTYIEHFDATARNINLEGRALFKVAKDSTRPFTVTARGFATTALATQFIVDATKSVVSIRLLTGKVMVNATKDAAIALEKTILSPGQELKINTETKHVEKSAAASLKATENNAAASLTFEKTTLPTVFKRLSEHYKTPILYEKADIQGLSFTGDFKSTDELDLALKVICNMNQLSFTKEKGRILIQKQQ
jgi:transmembrane sensor